MYMAMIQPDNHGQKNNPCNIKNNINIIYSTDNSNKGDYRQGPPDLDDIFKKISKKIKTLGRKNNSKSIQGEYRSYFNNHIVGIIAIVVTILWALSGVYVIKEEERGVVTRFGKFSHLVDPGLNWKPTFIDNITIVNVESIRELAASGVMLTADENIVNIEMNVQYRITNPERYLFSVTDADNSVRQATESAIREIIGKYTMDRILTKCRTLIRSETQRKLEDIISPYNMGVTLLDLNFQTARPPEEVKSAFDDVISAYENKQQSIREAQAYINEIRPIANSQAKCILEKARTYRTKTILEAQGEVARFEKLLTVYKASPNITKKRLYIETMEKVLKHSKKIIVNEHIYKNIIFIPINMNSITKKGVNLITKHNKNTTNNLSRLPSTSNNSINTNFHTSPTTSSVYSDVMEQRRINSYNNNYSHQGK